MFKKTLIFILCVWFLTVTRQPAFSAEIDNKRCVDDCCFSTRSSIDEQDVILLSTSTFRYWGFKVYTAAMYLSPETVKAIRAAAASEKDKDDRTTNVTKIVSGETPKKLLLCYHRNVTVEQFQDASRDALEDNPNVSISEISSALKRVNSVYESVKRGDTYSIEYRPGSKVMRLFRNDNLKIEIGEPAFISAYFGIWLSNYSVGKQFTRKLLGVD